VALELAEPDNQPLPAGGGMAGKTLAEQVELLRRV